MIGYLTGTVLEIEAKKIILLTTSGVGYEVFPAGELLAKSKKGEKLEAHIFMVVKETEISLYGFADKTEKQLFEKLISISGIGPKIAVQIVSTPVDSFMTAIEQGQVEVITQIPGIGKKMAQKMIVELQGKLDLSGEASVTSSMNTALQEAVGALEGLGYDRGTIMKVLEKAPDGSSTEDLVKYFLSSGV